MLVSAPPPLVASAPWLGAGAQRAPIAFDLVGATWSGSGSIRAELRARSSRGWTRWAPLTRDEPGASEPVWVGRSQLVQVRFRGRPQAVRLRFVRSGAGRGRPLRTLAEAGAPPIIARAAWGADEAMRRRDALVASGLRLAVIHHTATANDYSPEQSAGIVRSIYEYHVLHNGWNDIGYAFLIDRYGQIFEGRAGGIDLPVVGAHARGFNTGSAGIALIGNGSLEGVTAAQRASLVQLLTWRLDLAHIDPLGRVTLTSGGNSQYRAGESVDLRTISGHRDLDATSCPGDLVAADLDAFARSVADAPAPRIVAPKAERLPTGTVRVIARLLAATAWKATLLDSAGAPLATASGSGSAIDWSVPAPAAASWQIEASAAGGEQARPASGSLAGASAAAAAGVLASPALISPDGDGVADTTRFTATLAEAATISLTVEDASGVVQAEVQQPTALPAGPLALDWGGGGLPDGRYKARLRAVSAAGSTVDSTTPLTILRAIAGLDVTPRVGGRTTLRVRWRQLVEGEATILLLGRHPTFRLQASQRAVGDQELALRPAGRPRLPQGPQVLVLRVSAPLGTHELRRPLEIDTVSPRVSLLAIRLRRLTLRLGEPATIRIRRGARVIVPRVQEAAGVRRFVLRRPAGTPRTVTVEATDASGNVTTSRFLA